jgi:2'-hydroxyisoflavone reductase
MIRERRDFLTLATAAGAGAWIAASWAGRAGASDDDLPFWRRVEARKAARPLSILILGGTGFLGPHTVDYALARGHRVTLFNRGKRNPDLFPGLETILGDRDGKLDGLRGRAWDAVIDNSGYVPRIVRMSAEMLAPTVGQYLFVSSISVYGEAPRPGADETHPVEVVPDPDSEDVQKHYGGLKALCEKAAEAALPGRTTAIRPGLIVGPMDPSDRFTYWPVRVAKGGEVLAPGDGSDPVQLVDVRDLAAFIVSCVEDRSFGTFNAVGPERELTMKAMLEACRKGSRSDATIVWVASSFLSEQQVSPWSDMPAWVPGTGETAGFARVDVRRALAKGLRFRPILETAKDTLAWWGTLPPDRKATPRAGLDAEREAKVLAAWRQRDSRSKMSGR